MTAPDDLLRAILANPDDDNLRLVFADKLDDCGEAEHAEFVRVQCELAKCPLDEAAANSMAGYSHNQNSVRYATSIARLRRRERELWPKALFNILDEVRGMCLIPDAMIVYKDDERLNHMTNKSEAYVCRGFISEVHLSCQEWLVHGPALARRQPIEEVLLMDKRPGRMWGHDTGVEANYRRWWNALHSDANRCMDADVLPDCIFRCIVFPFDSGYHFPTEAAALDALSTAAIAWARQTEPATTSA